MIHGEDTPDPGPDLPTRYQPGQPGQLGDSQDVTIMLHNAQWAKSGFFVQWVYCVYLSSQNTRPLCNAAMYEQV